jgi:hydrogenase assembly chaperone HypC/HupF
MCLAIPGKIIEIEKNNATIDYCGEQRKAKILEGNYKKGDYVIVQARIIMMKVPQKEAVECIKALQKLSKS